MKIERQLLTGGTKEPTFCIPKRGSIRQLDLSEETIQLLRAHRRSQAEVKIADRYLVQRLQLGVRTRSGTSCVSRWGRAGRPYLPKWCERQAQKAL